MVVQTEGVVLKSIKYSETSLICKIYTQRFGLQSYLLQGVRKSKKGKANFYQLGNILDLEAYHNPSKNLQRIKEVKFAVVYQNMAFDIKKSAILLFMVELLNNAIREEEEAQDYLYDFIKLNLLQLDAAESPFTMFHLKFLIELAKIIGIAPIENYSNAQPFFNVKEGCFVNDYNDLHMVFNKELSHLMHQLLQNQIDNLSAVKASYALRKDLLNGLLRYMSYHLTDFEKLKSPEVLEVVFRA